jgi:hypothetical protein
MITIKRILIEKGMGTRIEYYVFGIKIWVVKDITMPYVAKQ